MKTIKSVINLVTPNCYMAKIDTIKYVTNLVTHNCYMAKIDIKDACYSIPILPKHKKFLNLVCKERFINSVVCLMDCGLVLNPR